MKYLTDLTRHEPNPATWFVNSEVEPKARKGLGGFKRESVVTLIDTPTFPTSTISPSSELPRRKPSISNIL
ncbi:hypothetical protein L1887_30032 [Cichorium endivia]|nr:hypothetical protein L1887_30032 [Cichorium endivia]